MKKIMYTVGMICRAIWPDLTDKPPLGYFDVLTTRPLSGLGLILKHPSCTKDKTELVMDLVDRISADLHDPKGGVKSEDQSHFWLGYYHLGMAIDAEKNYGPEELKSAGEALFGDRWQSDLARELDVDSRRVRQWLSGDRSIPAGVWDDIFQILRAREMKIIDVVRKLQ